MKTSRLGLVLFSLLAACSAAQDFPLREVNREQLGRVLDERLKDARLKVELLEKAREATRKVAQLEKQLEAAEEKDDEDATERLEESLERSEFLLELTLAKVDLLDATGRVRDLIAEMRQEEQSQLVKEAESLLTFQQRHFRTVDRFAELVRAGREEEAGELEERFEVAAERFELRLELLRVKFALHWAEQEQDEEAIEELKEEIQALLEEAKELSRERDESEANESEPNETEPNEREPNESRQAMRELELSKPLEVSEAEIRQAASFSLDDKIAPLLKRHCFDCHAEDASGDLNIRQLLAARPLVVKRKHWINITQQIKVGSMPPADSEQPSEDERRMLVAYLRNAIENYDYEKVRSPGYEPARRLTHAEYNHSIRDLFGVDIRPADRFPLDMTATSGFENSANSLFIQPILMERYLDAAEATVNATLPLPPTTDLHRAVRDRLIGTDSPRQAALRFAERAYRRPLRTDETKQITALFEKTLSKGSQPEEAFRNVVQAILISPGFLLRTEAGPATDDGRAFRISDFELASRLSFFLWASIPDERLLQRAKAGVLRKPAVLQAEVERMLQDDRSQTLGTLFASQWLGYVNLDRVQRDQIDNPWATDSLVEAMANESSLLFHSLVRDNAQIETLLTADYTFVNAELAKHYGMRGVEGDAMQRVSLDGQPRRGLLGHGSILTITSFPHRTSPVVRGNWVLTHLLGSPPPPPPPNVSQFDERVAENRRLSQKEKLKLHRRNPNCYACHSQIDPLGFALEQFDWFGRHRRRRTDTTGQLPSGRQFQGLNGLNNALIEERRDDLVRQLTRSMLAYALGRQLEYYDEATVRQLLNSVEQNERRFHPLIQAIVASDAFQMKQIPRTTP